MEVKDWQLFHPCKNGDRLKKELFDELVSYEFARRLPNNSVGLLRKCRESNKFPVFVAQAQ